MRRDVPRRVFRGREFAMVSADARRALGNDAVILGTRSPAPGVVDVLAAAALDVERFRWRLAGQRKVDDGDAPLPRVLALVGPTGAGKTTSAIKLALHAEAFGARRVGFITLDTYRAGAVAQLETYAEVARLPLEVAYDAADVPAALARLASCDAIIVDTPGRGPRTSDDDAQWRALLAALAPDEVHLVVPAPIRPDLAEALRDRFDAVLAETATPARSPLGVTHALLTKLDEAPELEGVADLAARLALPVRWVAEGQEIPADLARGVPRLVAALGSFAGVMALTLDRHEDTAPRRAAASGGRATA